jgi:ferredoxin
LQLVAQPANRLTSQPASAFIKNNMIGIINDKCDFCGTCVAVCPFDAIDLYEARIEINRRCTDCMLCVWICPVETLAPIAAQDVTQPARLGVD